MDPGPESRSPNKVFGFIPLSRFYADRRATALGKAFSHFFVVWASLGLPPWRQVGLELKGRKTGQPHRLAVVVAKHAGEAYLVSMLGQCAWVENARAHGDAVIISGRRRKVALEEIPVERRGPIIKEYLRLAPGGRPHIGLGKNATLADCERVAPDHPVFRVRYLDTGRMSATR